MLSIIRGGKRLSINVSDSFKWFHQAETRIDRRVAVGASPRASLAFLKMARARAALQGRTYILPDDIKVFAVPVLSHRMIMQPEFWMGRRVAEEVIADVLNKVSVPVVKGV